MESVHQLMLDDEIPENERKRLDPDHWYEINLTNAVLFSNLYLEHVTGLEQLVPGKENKKEGEAISGPKKIYQIPLSIVTYIE